MEITDSQRRDAVRILENWYYPGVIKEAEINEKVLETITKVLRESVKCSRPWSLLPNNPYIITRLWLLRMLGRLANGISHKTAPNHHCIKVLAGKYAPHIYCYKGKGNC